MAVSEYYPCGHPRTEENTYSCIGTRGYAQHSCRTCKNLRVSASNNRLKQERKLKAIARYGGKCVCCGETTPEFLTFHHINGDGAEERVDNRGKIGGNRAWWKALAEGPFREDLQIMCWNCNCAEGLFGECPHKRQMTVVI